MDDDGCMELDNDEDGVIDDFDECPDIPEEKTGNGDGCPDRGSVVIRGGKMIVIGKVLFETGSATIKQSEVLLDEIAGALKDHADIARITIEGHTDDVGETDNNQRLSEERAKSVERALVERGVADGRLHPVGRGETQPVAPNDTNAGRAKNRRVEFIIGD
jgi:outer membrane protein OmpA-like peptidoglycan-associated protein